MRKINIKFISLKKYLPYFALLERSREIVSILNLYYSYMPNIFFVYALRVSVVCLDERNHVCCFPNWHNVYIIDIL